MSRAAVPREAFQAPGRPSCREGDCNVREKTIRMDGCVVSVHPGDLYKVELEGTDAPVLAKRGGKIVKSRIRVVAGDRVTVEFTAYDPSRGRIVRRL